MKFDKDMEEYRKKNPVQFWFTWLLTMLFGLAMKKEKEEKEDGQGTK